MSVGSILKFEFVDDSSDYDAPLTFEQDVLSGRKLGLLLSKCIPAHNASLSLESRPGNSSSDTDISMEVNLDTLQTAELPALNLYKKASVSVSTSGESQVWV